MDFTRKISEIRNDELKAWLKSAFGQYAMDVGQKITDEELDNVVIRGYYQLTEQYSHWELELVKNTLKLVLNMEDNKNYRLTTKNLYHWFRYAKEKFAENDIRERQVEHFEEVYRHAKHDPVMSTVISNACLWKLSNFGKGKKYTISEWDNFPIMAVSECIQNGIDPNTICI